MAKEERGASLVEYALLVGLVALAAVAALVRLGGSASDRMEEVAVQVEEEPSGSPSPSTAPPGTEAPPPVPTTTTTPPSELPATSGFGAAEVVDEPDGWHAVTDLVVRDGGGAPLPAVPASVRIWRYQRTSSGWAWRSRYLEVVTEDDGVVGVQTSSFPDSGTGAVSRVIFTLVDVDDHRWDGVQGNLDVRP